MDLVKEFDKQVRESVKKELNQEREGVPIYIDSKIIEKVNSMPSDAERMAKAVHDWIEEVDDK